MKLGSTKTFDRYALLIVENLDAKALIIFSRSGLEGVCVELGKRHPNQDRTPQFGRRNYLSITANPDRFEQHGVTVVSLT